MTQRISLSENSPGMMLCLTLGCDIRCRHCIYDCGAERLGVRMTSDEIELAVGTAKSHNIGTICLAGGEPSLVWDLVALGLRHVRHAGLSAFITTNAAWAKTPALAYDRLAALADLGLRSIAVSYDRYHAEFVPAKCVINACEQAERLGYEVKIEITDPIDTLRQRTLRRLKSIERFIPNNAFKFPAPVGRASDLSAGEVTTSFWLPLECSHFAVPHRAFIGVFPGRVVSFCCECANPRLTYRYPLKEDWLTDMMDAWNSDECVKAMWYQGLSQLSGGYNVVNGHPCAYCFRLLPALFPGKEMIDICKLA